ncbi:MAG: stage II sporulation protein R [Clostridia bacterium]|nr:stage II sporulation protein R [Clostridia bacterium]
MKYLIVVCTVFLVVSLIFVSNSASEFRDGFIRLHILAESDGELDQSIKLSLRDALLDEYGEQLSGFSSKESAEFALTEKLSGIEQFCNSYLSELGVDYKASATLDREYYPNRVYNNVSLPAGTYSSLKITLGSGEGQNWWCVLFPPMCTSVATDKDAYIAAGLSREDFEMITNSRTPKYEIKFKIFELFGKLFK